jgi:hypothetical protein
VCECRATCPALTLLTFKDLCHGRRAEQLHAIVHVVGSRAEASELSLGL